MGMLERVIEAIGIFDKCSDCSFTKASYVFHTDGLLGT